MSETLEHAQARTDQFIALLVQEMSVMGFQPDEEPFVLIAMKVSKSLETPEEHYEMREQLAGAFSSAAYKFLMRKWQNLPDFP